MFGIFSATRRQGFIGGLLSSGGWILPVTGIGFAGLFREEIAEIGNDLVIDFEHTPQTIRAGIRGDYDAMAAA